MESLPFVICIHTVCTNSVRSFLTAYDIEGKAINAKTPLKTIYEIAATKADFGFSELVSINACFASRFMEYDPRTFMASAITEILDCARAAGSSKGYYTLFFVFRRPIATRTLGESRKECQNLLMWMLETPVIDIALYTGFKERYECCKVFLPSR